MPKESTDSIHGHGFFEESTGAFIPPIYLSVVYEHPERRSGKPRLTDRGTELRYGREENPTVRALEHVLAVLEAGGDALAFNSGMAAISATALSILWERRGGKIVTTKEGYGRSIEFLRRTAELSGIGFNAVWPSTEAVIEAISKDTSLVFIETITNPMLRVLDVRSIAEHCRDLNVPLIVDNTFASPVIYNPLKDSASLVVHSLTKYIAGHNDVLGGAVVGSVEDIKGIWEWRALLGGIMQAFDAYLALRGIKTLELRVERQSTTALAVAEFLRDHPRVLEVYYPGLSDSPYKPVADKLFKKKLYGGVVSFELKSEEEALRFIRKLRIVKASPSLGGTESLVTMPARTVASTMTPEDRRALGINEGLLRLAVGLEDPEDVIEDLSQALQ